MRPRGCLVRRALTTLTTFTTRLSPHLSKNREPTVLARIQPQLLFVPSYSSRTTRTRLTYFTYYTYYTDYTYYTYYTYFAYRVRTGSEMHSSIAASGAEV